ncbi:hypothetical protein HJC23_011227 [Cyclotella cryptica]|uniref:Uncharacterized protein n=1 Tax=Cyclotella cryptica TaxID=29204 RepID=A0ABD3PW91_9STRA
MSSVTFSEETARDTMESSRRDVMHCEKEIQSIKDSLKLLNPGAGAHSDEDSLNALKVTVNKVRFNGEEPPKDVESPPTFKVHLSSPIEVRTITKLHDPLDPSAEGSFALFKSVEISNALLTVEAFSSADASDGTKLGVSAAHDLLPLFEDLESSTGADTNNSSTLEIAIVSENRDLIIADLRNSKDDDESKASRGGDEGDKGGDYERTEDEEPRNEEGFETSEEKSTAATGTDRGDNEGSETNDGNPEPAADRNDSGQDKSVGDDERCEGLKGEADVVATEETNPGQNMSDAPKEESKVQIPVCVLSVHLEYTPSLNDKRDALYNKLNEVSKRKAAAIEALRKSAAAVNRARAEQGMTSDNVEKSTAVKSGFLKKSKASGSGEKNTPPPLLKRVYEKTFGPQSMLWVVGPIAKNYVVFFAVSVFFHFKGDLLALPPPV